MAEDPVGAGTDPNEFPPWSLTVTAPFTIELRYTLLCESNATAVPDSFTVVESTILEKSGVPTESNFVSDAAEPDDVGKEPRIVEFWFMIVGVVPVYVYAAYTFDPESHASPFTCDDVLAFMILAKFG